jgi:serine/threonine protein kinase/tetratricopeptide (TPR) repeat protein
MRSPSADPSDDAPPGDPGDPGGPGDPGDPGGPGGPGLGHFRPGDRFGRYEIEALLGEGGMGRVYRALDTRLGRKIALKVIAATEGDPRAAERTARLAREARAAAALDHPNAVSIFDVGEIDGVSFIAMELVTGHTLRRYIESAAIGWPERLRWLVEIGSALAAAHGAGLIHRDVKPDNVMIRSDGRVKVLDFGIARRASATPDAGAPASLPTITGELGLIGTPLYMAPEQLLSAPLDGRTDQFAWGVLSYELLTGQPPWSGEPIAVISQILSQPPAPIRRSRPEIPSAVEEIVMRTLAKSPGDRFRSMEEVIAALEPFAADSRSAVPLPPIDFATALQETSVASTISSGDPSAVHQATSQSSERAEGGPRAKGSPAGPAEAVSAIDTRRSAESIAKISRPEGPRAAAGARLRWRMIGFAAGTMLLAAAASFAVQRLRSEAPSASASSSAKASAAAPVPTAVTDLPSPASSNAEAVAAYRVGLAALRIAGAFGHGFERAVEIDPSLAAAHLQIAVAGAISDVNERTRDHFRKAEELRAKLSPRDQALLDAIEPIVRRQPSDWVEANRRMKAAIERFPHDAQLWFELAMINQNSEGLEASNRDLDRALTEDPSFAAALAFQGQNLAYLGRFTEARKALETCNRIAPSSYECMINLAHLSAQEGACGDVESMGRQLIASGSKPDEGYWQLALSLAAQGKPEATVREALKRRAAATPDANRKQVELRDQIRAAIWTGDFEAAERDARAFLMEVEPSARQYEHGRPALLLVQILAETGRAGDAGRIAMDFLNRQDVWEPDPRAEDYAISRDVTPALLAAAQRAGLLSRDEFLARRQAWMTSWERKVGPVYRNHLWMQGYAAIVDTKEDASAALNALERYAPIAPFRPMTLSWMGVGPAYLLGGRVEDAVTWLEGVTKSCLLLQFPMEHTHGSAWLGLSRAQQGDQAAACSAYRTVVERWGGARPKSVTAEKVKERMKALGCER